MTQRREFFKELLSHIYVMKEEMAGHRHFKLTDLWKLDESKFRQLKLRIRDDVSIKEAGGKIVALKSDGEEVFLFKKESQHEYIFNLLKQKIIINSIVEKFTLEHDATSDEAFQFVRDVALSLVKQSICIPANDIHFES